MKQPQLTTPSDISLHEPLRRTLPNGVTIHTLCAAEFEVVRVSFVFRAGSAQQRKAFVATSTANLLSEGTRDMTSQQIAEQFDFYGSYFDVNVDRDYVYISFCSLSKYFRQTLAVAEQILLHPLFPEEEVASYREKRKQRLRIERMKVETEAREAFARALFGPAHPYGITWPETAYDDLTRDDLLDFYARHYTARNCFVVCSGAADAAVVDAVAEVAGQLPAGADRAAEPFPPAVTTPHAAVPHAGAVQSSIRIGRLLFGRNHPDYVGMQVVAMLLGGYFGSRLMQNLREANGFTYGVVAAMVNLEREGYLAVATQVARDATEQALAEIYREIERLRTEPVAEEELSLVRNMMTGEMMRILDVRHRRRHDRKHPLRPTQRRRERESATHPRHYPRRGAAARREIPAARSAGHGRGGRTGKRPLTGRRQFGRRHPIPARRSRNLLFRTKCVIFVFVPQGLFGKLGF